MQCTYTYQDSDNDPDATTISWKINGSDSGISSPTLNDGFVSGDEVTCEVTPSDGFVNLPSVTESIMIGNRLPVVDDASIQPEEPIYTDDVLIVDAKASDIDGQNITFSTSWYIDSVWINDGDTLDGGQYFAKNQQIYAEIVPNDGINDGTPYQTTPVKVSNTPPTVVDTTIEPEKLYAGDVPSCRYTFTDADNDADNSVITWFVEGIQRSTTPTGFVRGQEVVCQVTPNDSEDDGIIQTDTVIVENTKPKAKRVGILPENAKSEDTLTCNYSFSDPDGDNDLSSISWFVNGINKGFGPTLSSGYVGGDEVRCDVTPFDGALEGTVKNASVTINNTAPVVSSVRVSPDQDLPPTALIAPYTYVDADGDQTTV